MADGVNTQVSIGQESGWGTGVTPTVSLPVVGSDGIQPKQENVGIEGLNTHPAKNKSHFAGKRTWEGGFSMPAYPRAIGYLIKSALGSVADSGAESGVFNHVFAETISKASLTVETYLDANYCKRVAGYIVQSFKVSGKVGEAIMLAFDGKGKTAADATKITAAYETNRPFNWTDIDTISIGGTDIKSVVEDFEVEYKNGLELFHGFDGGEASAKYVKQSEVVGKLTLYLDANAYAQLASLLAATEAQIIIDMTGELVGATKKDQFKLTIPKCAIQKFETPIGFDYTAVTLEFSGRQDSSIGLIKVEVQNVVTAY